MIFLNKNIDHFIGDDGLDELASIRDVSCKEISCSLVCGNQIGGLTVGSCQGIIRWCGVHADDVVSKTPVSRLLLFVQD